MNKLILKSIIFLLFLIYPSIHHSTGLENNNPLPAFHKQNVIHSMSALPLYFVENYGQLRESVKFHLKMSNANVYFTSGEIVYQFFAREDDGKTQKERSSLSKKGVGKNIRVDNVRVSFLGANENVEIEGLEKGEAKVSYFFGKDPHNWVKGISTYHKLKFGELYPHIDLFVHGEGGRIKKEYRVKIGGDAEEIKIGYEGIEKLRLNELGQLEVYTNEGKFIEDVPISYQVINGKRVEVQTEYTLESSNSYGFKLNNYRKDKELIIDPELIYSTYLGGSGDEGSHGIAVDGGGNAYVTGNTYSINFPTTPGAVDTSLIGSWTDDAFVAKINSTGTDLLYATYLGGSDDDGGFGIAVDGSGNAYISGNTWSSDFPTTSNVIDTSTGGEGDVFITKLNSTGTNLLYSTYLGGDEYDGSSGIAVDGSENAYVTGNTYSNIILRSGLLYCNFHVRVGTL